MGSPLASLHVEDGHPSSHLFRVRFSCLESVKPSFLRAWIRGGLSVTSRRIGGDRGLDDQRHLANYRWGFVPRDVEGDLVKPALEAPSIRIVLLETLLEATEGLLDEVVEDPGP